MNEKHRNKFIRIAYGDLRIIACGYILLPMVIFLVGFLKWFFALPAVAAVAFAFWQILHQKKDPVLPARTVVLRHSSIWSLFLIMLLWTQLGGMNGILYQSTDWPWRNAIFRDLITHRWPVRYPASDTALVYYIGHWLPAAVVAKGAQAIFHSEAFTWLVGRMGLWLWSSLGLVIVVLLLFLHLNATTSRKRLIAVIVFIFFSGLDILGAFHTHRDQLLLRPDILHLEWWNEKNYQFTSMTACIYWVFNQSIIPWIVTLLFMLDPDERHYIAYGAACMLCGPLPLVGLAMLMIVRAVIRMIACLQAKNVASWLRTVFSWDNLVVLIAVMPFLAAYLLSNNSLSADSQSEQIVSQTSFFSASYWNGDLLFFYLIEVGAYLLLVWDVHRRDVLYYAVALSLLCIPYFHVGEYMDFCMRASLPGVFITMTYVGDYVCKYLPKRGKKRKKPYRSVIAVILAVFFLIGAYTPYTEIYRGLYHVVTKRTIFLAQDDLITLDSQNATVNFSASDADQVLFFRVLAR